MFHGVGGVAYVEGVEDGLSALTHYSNTWTQSLESLAKRSTVPYNSDSDFNDDKQLISTAPVYSPFVRHNK